MSQYVSVRIQCLLVFLSFMACKPWGCIGRVCSAPAERPGYQGHRPRDSARQGSRPPVRPPPPRDGDRRRDPGAQAQPVPPTQYDVYSMKSVFFSAVRGCLSQRQRDKLKYITNFINCTNRERERVTVYTDSPPRAVEFELPFSLQYSYILEYQAGRKSLVVLFVRVHV